MADPEETTAETAPEPEVEETLPADAPLAPDARPTRNVLAEIQRRDREGQQRLTKIERQNADILAAFQSFQQQRPAPAPVAPAPVSGSEYTDEQLGQLAAAGNAEALRILVARQSQRDTAAQMQTYTQSQQVGKALEIVFTKYPMLRSDPQHPLTQAVYATRNSYLAQGWQPGPVTDLEAIKATFLSAAHLVPSKEDAAMPQDTTRRAGVTAQQSMDGAASRRSPQSAQTAAVKPLDAKVAGIAQRMDVKDPQNSLKRFMDRQTGKRSTVSPVIQQAVREEQA